MRPLLGFIALFPLLELWLLVKLGGWLGALPTVGLVVASALLGMAILLRVGWHTLAATQLRMRQQASPLPVLLDGVALALAGVLLLLPGVLSDAVAVVLLIAPLRRWLARRLGAGSPVVASYRAERSADVIEGEYRREP